jgi:hypothetical protein
VSTQVISSLSTAADLRRVTIIAACLGVAGVVLASLAGRPWLGVFALLGLVLGLLNAVLLRRAAARFAGTENARKSHFALGSLGRLAFISVLALGLATLVRPDGLGVFAGLAAFQLLLIGAALVPMLRELRRSGTGR